MARVKVSVVTIVEFLSVSNNFFNKYKEHQNSGEKEEKRGF